MATEPGRKDAVRLTAEAKKKWTLLAWRNTTTGRIQLNTPQNDGTAYFSSTKDGEVSTSWEAIVTPRCYTLDYSERVNVNTAPNCAGVDPSLRMYNPGTVVHVSWDSGHDDSWGGWDGASGSQDDGTVVMDQDRTVRATWTHDDNFKTNILEPLSNAAQRSRRGDRHRLQLLAAGARRGRAFGGAEGRDGLQRPRRRPRDARGAWRLHRRAEERQRVDRDEHRHAERTGFVHGAVGHGRRQRDEADHHCRQGRQGRSGQRSPTRWPRAPGTTG